MPIIIQFIQISDFCKSEFDCLLVSLLKDLFQTSMPCKCYPIVTGDKKANSPVKHAG